MARYGTTSHPLFGYSAGDNSDNLRGTVFGSMPEHGHAYSMGIRAGYYDSGDPGTVKLALYGTSSGNPSSRKGYTGTINLNSRMADAGDGQDYTADLLSAVALSSGSKYGLAALFHGGRMAHGQNTVADQMYRRDTSATTPPDPMGYSSSGTETQISIWVNYQANSAPNIPSGASPADSASFTTTAPTYAADFRDADETLPNGLASDYLNAYQVQVRSVAADGATTGTLVWDAGTVGASDTEKNNRRFSIVHGGSALTPGQRYQWRSRVQDRFGAWSGYTDWTAGDFLVSGAAIVTLDGTPFGRTTSLTPGFQGRYNHVSGTSSSNVQVRLYIGDTLVATSPSVAKVVASSALPGTLYTISWAESGFSTLASGVEYSYQERAMASGVWSDWSARRDFKTNTAPTTPSNLQPTGGAASTALPLLTVRATDADFDALTVSARIKNNASTVLKTRTMSYDGTLYSGTGGYKYQLIAGTNEVQTITITGSPTGGTFTLTYSGQTTAAIAYNAAASTVQSALNALSSVPVGSIVCTGGPLPGTGVVCSFVNELGATNVAAMTFANSLTGGTSPTVVVTTTTSGVDGDTAGYGYATYRFDANASDGDLTSPYSGEAVFVYAAGPSITVTSPTEAQVITTAAPTITWTVANQVSFRVQVYLAAYNTQIHDSGTVVSAASSYALPTNILANNTNYYVTVTVTDTAPLTGTSAIRNFSLVYTAPATITSFMASPDLAAMDTVPSVVRLTWDPVATTAATFLTYRIFRRRSGQQLFEADWMADLSSIDQNAWVDVNAPPAVDLIYSIQQIVQPSALDILTSAPAESLVNLALGGSVISDVRNGLTLRAAFDHVDERTETPVKDQTEINTWDGGAPWLLEGPTDYTTIQMSARLIASDAATVAQQLTNLRALCGRRSDGSPVLSCYRDERGRRMFGRARDLEITDQRLLRADVQFTFTELAYSDVMTAAG